MQATGSCPDYGGNGGNGGGASFIADSTSGNPIDLAVAGGGGGGGGGTDQPVCGPGAGGGNFAQNGGDRIEFYCAIESTVANSGGTSDVNSNGIGGNGSNSTSIETVGGGGGGGGGWHGAGGGTAGEIGGGAGGGGGTSLVPSGWTVGAPSGCADGSTPVFNICANLLGPRRDSGRDHVHRHHRADVVVLALRHLAEPQRLVHELRRGRGRRNRSG